MLNQLAGKNALIFELVQQTSVQRVFLPVNQKTGQERGNARNSGLGVAVGIALGSFAVCVAIADPLPPSATYRPLPNPPFLS